MKRFGGRSLLPLLLAAIVVTGCTTSHYRRSADKETYGVIREKTPLVKNMDPGFTIEQANAISLDGFSIATNVEVFLGVDGERERGAHMLSLEDALSLAIHHSRTYQSRKERLYLSGLSLTLARHQFTPIFSASGDPTYSVINQEDATVSDHFVEQHSVNGSGNIDASWLLRDVGRITTAFTTDFVRFFSGDPRLTTSSKLGATFLRPLLQDAGFKQDRENLTQAERNLLYELRGFTQFRKDFSVQVASSYYGVLGARDTIRNSFLNLQRSRGSAERNRALAQEGRITQADLGRLEQQAFSTETAWINAIRNYKQSLDNFKIQQLGLTVDANIVLDDRDLESLQIRHPDIDVEQCIQVALAARLDYLNSKDQLQDATRQVDLAANFLKPRIDLTASAAVVSDPDKVNGMAFPDPKRYQWDAGLIVDPGLDRKAERNSYREALIARDQAARNLEELGDNIKLQVRESWRTLNQAKRNYEISENGLTLAERRVEEQYLLAELGRARAQDQVDAENDLNNFKNQRTQALITHTTTRLQFWKNMGILYIKDNGQWEENQNAEAP